MSRRDDGIVGVEPGGLPSTHWSVVVRAGDSDAETARRTVKALLERYYEALRVHLVAVKRIPRDEAEDILHGFIASKVLEDGLLARANQKRGKFRTFLLSALDHYAVDEARRRQAGKRCPEGGLLPLDDAAAGSVRPCLGPHRRADRGRADEGGVPADAPPRPVGGLRVPRAEAGDGRRGTPPVRGAGDAVPAGHPGPGAQPADHRQAHLQALSAHRRRRIHHGRGGSPARSRGAGRNSCPGRRMNWARRTYTAGTDGGLWRAGRTASAAVSCHGAASPRDTGRRLRPRPADLPRRGAFGHKGGDVRAKARCRDVRTAFREAS